MGICMSPTIRISYFFLTVGRGNSKPPIVIVENFPIELNTMNLRLFLQKVYRMLITINMKSDIAFVAVNNSPCSIQKGSTKDDRHTVVLGNIKNNKVRQDQGSQSGDSVIRFYDYTIQTNPYDS